MAFDPRNLPVGLVDRTNERVGQRTPLATAAVDTFASTVDPIFEFTRNTLVYGVGAEAGYDFRTSIPEGYERFANSYALAVNEQHAGEITRAIDESFDRRRRLGEASGVVQFAAELANPINWLAIPIAAPAAIGGKYILSSALRSGAAVGAVEAAARGTIIQPFDPVSSYTETFMNAAGAAVFGGAFGGLVSIPTGIRGQALANMRGNADQMFRSFERITDLGNLKPSDLQARASREEREFGNLEDDGLNGELGRIDSEINTLQSQLNEVEAGSGEHRLINDQIDQLRAQRLPLGHERTFRRLETEGIDTDNLYSYAAGGDNIILNFVTTPMRRAIRAAIPDSVKERFVSLAGDSGMLMRLHEFGFASPQSVSQRSAVEIGRLYRSYTDLQQIWAKETNASMAGRFDRNLENITRTISRSDDTFDNWLTGINRKRTLRDANLTEAEAKAIAVIDDYFDDARVRLEDVGLLGTRENIRKEVQSLEQEIKSLEARIEAIDRSTKGGQERRRSLLDESLNDARARLEQRQLEVENLVDAESPDPFLPRFWQFDQIRKRRDEFEKILTRWFEEQPYIFSFNEKTKKWERIELSRAPDDIARRVNETIDTILGEVDQTNFDKMGFGTARSKHFNHRRLDIPNHLVSDFIEMNPLAIMKTYAARVEPRYHFAKQFGNKNISQILREMELEMLDKNVSQNEINKTKADFRVLYNRVVGQVLESPDAMNQKIAFVIKELASFNFMGASGIAAIADFGRIVMEHELGSIIKAGASVLDKNSIKRSLEETRLAGSAMDMFLGSAFMRVMDDVNTSFLSSNAMNKLRNAFYDLNLLGPVTTLAKELDGMVTAHALIDYSIKVSDGTASAFERNYLLRYGISEEQSMLLARAPWQRNKEGLILPNTDEWANAYEIPELAEGRVNVIEINEDGTPVGRYNKDGEYVAARYNQESNTIFFDRDYIEGEMFDRKAWTTPRMEGVKPLKANEFTNPKDFSNFVMWHEIMHTRFSAEDLGLEPRSAAYENKINQMALREHRNSKRVGEELVTTFRTALNSSVLNTIMSATPADKPIINDGIVLVPEHIGRKFGLEPHPDFEGYSKIENGLLALPFQFYSFALANVNKTVGLMMQGQVRNRGIGMIAMLGAGYLATSIRTPDFVWEDMSPQDKFARSFDMAGIAALYSDMFYTAMHTTLALGGPNITGGFISPKFPQEPSAVDAITGFTGAGTAWTADMIGAMAEMAGGNYGEGGKDAIRLLPFARMWFWRDDVNQMTNRLAQ
jgi:prefoldin subunit 5